MWRTIAVWAWITVGAGIAAVSSIEEQNRCGHKDSVWTSTMIIVIWPVMVGAMGVAIGIAYALDIKPSETKCST